MPLDLNRVQERRLPDGTTFDLYVPPQGADRVLVSVIPVAEPEVPRVWGVETFIDFADEHGYLVLAPCFAFASDFRFLTGATVRYDLVLLEMIEEVARAYAVNADTITLFGYSAGGQFAHRFLYVHPERLAQVAIGAPGRVAIPDPRVPWPEGVADLPDVTGKVFDLEAVRRPRILLYIGDQDTDAVHLDQTEGANRFGRNRLERARFLHRAWREANIPHEYVEVPGMKHDNGDIEVAWAFFSRH